jgi:hypothetical protein
MEHDENHSTTANTLTHLNTFIFMRRTYQIETGMHYGFSQIRIGNITENRNDSTIQNFAQIPLKFEKVYAHHTFKDLKM